MLLLVFAFGGIFGFIYEEIFYRFDLGEWVKRGTTFGPWIPIYGFGGIIMLGLTYKISISSRQHRGRSTGIRNWLRLPHFFQRPSLGL